MRHSLEVLLTLLVHEVAAGDCPAFCFLWERDGACNGEVAVVCSAEGKIAHELEVANAVGAELKVADGEAEGNGTAEGLVVDRLEGEGETDVGGRLGGCTAGWC